MLLLAVVSGLLGGSGGVGAPVSGASGDARAAAGLAAARAQVDGAGVPSRREAYVTLVTVRMPPSVFHAA